MATVEYSAELGARIADLVAGGRTITAVCKMDGMPDPVTVQRWRLAHPEFDAAINEAREALSDALVEQALEIVDTDPDPQRAHNRAEARRWLASSLHPDAYAPRQKIDVNVEHRIDLNEARQEARARLESSGRALPGNIIDAEVIEVRPLGVDGDEVPKP